MHKGLLTPREKRIMQMLAGGYDREAIVGALSISRSTYVRAVNNAMHKAGSVTPVEAVVTLLALGHIPLPILPGRCVFSGAEVAKLIRDRVVPPQSVADEYRSEMLESLAATFESEGCCGDVRDA